MPALDRRITVRTTRTVQDDQGRTSETTSDVSVWATRHDDYLQDTPTEAGQRVEASRLYRIRWRSDIAAATPAELSIIEGGRELQVDDLVEAAERGPLRERRRFLELRVIGEVFA